MDKSGDIVEVGLGILLRECPEPAGESFGLEVLISRRPASTVYAGWWEIPGGKVDPGETPDEAVVRELAEEVGVQAIVVASLATVEHAYDHARVRLHLRICRLGQGSPSPRPLHVDACRWIPVEAMRQTRFPEANEPVVEETLRWVREHAGGWADR